MSNGLSLGLGLWGTAVWYGRLLRNNLKLLVATVLLVDPPLAKDNYYE